MSMSSIVEMECSVARRESIFHMNMGLRRIVSCQPKLLIRSPDFSYKCFVLFVSLINNSCIIRIFEILFVRQETGYFQRDLNIVSQQTFNPNRKLSSLKRCWVLSPGFEWCFFLIHFLQFCCSGVFSLCPLGLALVFRFSFPYIYILFE